MPASLPKGVARPSVMATLPRHQQIWLLRFLEMEIAGPMFVCVCLCMLINDDTASDKNDVTQSSCVKFGCREAEIMAGLGTIMNSKNDILTRSRIRKFREKATFCPQRWFPVPATAIFICTHSNFETCNLSHSYVTS